MALLIAISVVCAIRAETAHFRADWQPIGSNPNATRTPQSYLNDPEHWQTDWQSLGYFLAVAAVAYSTGQWASMFVARRGARCGCGNRAEH